MIRLGLRLSLNGGKEAMVRVFVTAAAVALGVGLLLAALAGGNGLNAQTDRGAWLDSAAQASRTDVDIGRAVVAVERRSVRQPGDRSRRRCRGRTERSGPAGDCPPTRDRGEYYASPALTTLIASQPANELRDRFPGRQIGTIGAAALPSPNSLIVVIGHTASQLSRAPGAVEVGAIQRTPANCYACQNPVGSGPDLQWILAGGAVFLLLPVLILIATASRLSAARREERFAAMRLVGATPRQISVVSAVEAVVAALAGVAVGFALFFAFRPLLYHVPFTGAPFAPGDLSLHGIDIVLVVIGVPVAAVVSALVALRRVQISPLSVNRRASSRPPRIVRIIPLLAGIAVLAYFDAHGKPGSNGGQLLELLVGFVLLVVGLVLAGPWFTTAGSRLMAKRASRPATLIAGRRLLDNPKAAFRFISGLVIALFVASALIGALSSIATVSSSGGGTRRERTPSPNRSAASRRRTVPLPRKYLRSQARCLPSSTPRRACVAWRWSTKSRLVSRRTGAGRLGLSRAPSWQRPRRSARALRGATVASIGYFLSNVLGHNSHASSTAWPSAHLSAAKAARLPVERGCRRHRRVLGIARTGTDHARTGVSLPGTAARSRVARSVERAPSYDDPGHDRHHHRGEPHHRRLQSRGEHRRRVGRAQAPVQPAQAHRCPHQAPASRRRIGECPPTPPCRRGVDRGRPRVCRPLPPLPGRHRVPHSRDRVLGDRGGRTRRVARDHRLDVPAPQPDDGTRGRPKRLTALRLVHGSAASLRIELPRALPPQGLPEIGSRRASSSLTLLCRGQWAGCLSCRACTPGSRSLPYGTIGGSLRTSASRKACTYGRSWSIRALSFVQSPTSG